ncbi:hypothetical protein NHX12_006397 [Muraenolepis orangiensis]|uniref:Uncharacterized protein n=1 Tax=Muraenolepis orangiensis TaxID=630683 RepID=A0A9Q0DVR2_9TELE|nr:hypothetical protein NHX12_006397 [Muraenolepis orangiensis]
MCGLCGLPFDLVLGGANKTSRNRGEEASPSLTPRPRQEAVVKVPEEESGHGVGLWLACPGSDRGASGCRRGTRRGLGVQTGDQAAPPRDCTVRGQMVAGATVESQKRPLNQSEVTGEAHPPPPREKTI